MRNEFSRKVNIKQKNYCSHLIFFSLQDHLQEVIEKWDSIDDEIWAKVIVLERNRRVAKGQLISKEISFAVNSSKNERKNLPKIYPEVHLGQFFSNDFEEMKS